MQKTNICLMHCYMDGISINSKKLFKYLLNLMQPKVSFRCVQYCLRTEI